MNLSGAQIAGYLFIGINALLLLFYFFGSYLTQGEPSSGREEPLLARAARRVRVFFTYELLILGASFMMMPFYWMVVTSFKDKETAVRTPPEWLPYRVMYTAPTAKDQPPVEVLVVSTRREPGKPVTVVAMADVEFTLRERDGARVHERFWDKSKEFQVDGNLLKNVDVARVDIANFKEAWYRPEVATRGAANFGRYFWVSTMTSIVATIGTLFTGALAAFAFSRFEFWGKGVLFYVVLATMMVPGQVLLIPNFLILSKFQMLDTYSALIVPWLASVFTIFLMRQFFMTIPNDLWEAARIDGASHFRYLWQVVFPLSKPVFITAGIFNFLNNWNSLLWPLIVTTQPEMRTLMVGLQSFNEDAGTDFHLLMAASTLAILPVVVLFFLLQRFFIEGIARTGLK